MSIILASKYKCQYMSLKIIKLCQGQPNLIDYLAPPKGDDIGAYMIYHNDYVAMNLHQHSRIVEQPTVTYLTAPQRRAQVE